MEDTTEIKVCPKVELGLQNLLLSLLHNFFFNVTLAQLNILSNI